MLSQEELTFNEGKMVYKNKQYDEERALYGEENIVVSDCLFDGVADGGKHLFYQFGVAQTA